MKKPITPETVKLRLAGLCARSEQSEFDIIQKLRKYEISITDKKEIFIYLRKNKFIDNARFARSFARDKIVFSHWGKNKIKLYLRQKKIDASLITQALETIDPEEYNQSLLKIATAKARTLDLTTYDDRLKLYRHLLSRGFESPLISSTIKTLQSQP